MNNVTICLVFFSGVFSTFLFTFLTSQCVQNEFLNEELERNELIKNRKKIFEHSQKLVFIPDESHFSVSSGIPDESQLSVLITEESAIEKVLHQKRLNEQTKAGMFVLEALAALNAALEMNKAGKHAKALKLFHHALAMQPNHPDILNNFGEFLEETEKNVLDADYHYSRALTFSPNHDRALQNRHRTSPMVDELDNNFLKKIDRKRNDLLNVPETNGGLRRMKKEAYYQYIYHTLGIEGNTMSLAQTRAILETRMAVAGKSITEHNEILGLDSALKYINNTLVHRIGAITLDDVLEIHKRVLGFVDIFEGGRLRSTQVFVGNHIPPPPSELKYLMDEFVTWLNSVETLSLHPVRFAALAHYKLVYIHPFSDGNGRTSRLLMNLILMQAGYPPVIIRKQDRDKYYDYLEQANEGDVRPFIRFIALQTEQTLDVYLWGLFVTTADRGTNVPELAQEDDGKTIIISYDH